MLVAPYQSSLIVVAQASKYHLSYNPAMSTPQFSTFKR
ncbi:hypothetical protein OYT1_ch2328 [Ferriphaselus amnicola]|uniref:Uncharacterized protein n=1 Tax=Ferriphaselus amnicola TaxID=1188319 RepID=A0A2Z6GF24_9PROT|nr:hypothetical protein OYT1_ch2328 [Ferriphaselus amnicola]